MNQRTEPTNEENKAAIAELKRELRGPLPIKFKDARIGRARSQYIECYSVRAIDNEGHDVQIALFTYDDDQPGSRETARILAEELVERLNEA